MEVPEAEARIYEHLEALRACVQHDLQEPQRSIMVQVCNSLTLICCPTINENARRALYALEAKRWRQSVVDGAK